jgi:hypothetical protein
MESLAVVMEAFVKKLAIQRKKISNPVQVQDHTGNSWIEQQYAQTPQQHCNPEIWIGKNAFN